MGFPKSSLEKWAGGRRMPTNDEINELLQFCSWEKRSRNNINGYNLIGPNENHIFLPMEGYIFPGVPSPVNGYYWSRTRKSRIDSYGLYFDWEYGYYGIEDWECLVGAAIRPVKDKEIRN